jgi:hypothetical protein
MPHHRPAGCACTSLRQPEVEVVLLLDEWQSRGIAFVTLGEGIDTSTAAGRGAASRDKQLFVPIVPAVDSVMGVGRLGLRP